MDDRYELLEPLGSGGMATVHRAWDRVLNRHVAVKRLLPHVAADPGAAERFRREAQAAAGLNHPGIVTVFDTAEDAEGPYIVMELVEGETLAAKVRREGPLPVPEAVALVRRIAEAVDHAHARGVVHRDIKPSNLLLAPDGGVRLGDFGIARAREDPTAVTGPGEVVGTLAYLAPEVLAGEPASPASDVYSLGAVTYEMLAGRPPFAEDELAAFVARVREEDPPPLGPDVPAEVAAAVLRSLARDPARRPGSAGAFATSLLAGTTAPWGPLPPTRTLPAAPAVPSEPPAGDERSGDERSGDERSGDERSAVQRTAGAGRRFPIPVALLLLLLVSSAVLAARALAPDPGGAPLAAGSTVPTTLPAPAPTTVPTPPTTAPDSPEAISSVIYGLLGDLQPPEFKPRLVREVRDRLDGALEEVTAADREDAAEAFEKAFRELGKLPDGEERDRLVAELVRLAESYGFTVDGDGLGDGDD